jgi:hypothetical protein
MLIDPLCHSTDRSCGFLHTLEQVFEVWNSWLAQLNQ